MKKQTLPLTIFAALVIFLAIGLTLNPKEVPSPLIGKPAVHFELEQLENRQTFSPKELHGQIWLFNVWASWCASCKEEHEVLLELTKTTGLPIVGLNYKDTPLEALDWLKRYNNPYKVVVQDPSGKAGIDWGVYGVPETFVIDAEGVIRHKFTGPVTMAKVRDELLPLLKELKFKLEPQQ